MEHNEHTTDKLAALAAWCRAHPEVVALVCGLSEQQLDTALALLGRTNEKAPCVTLGEAETQGA